MQSTRKVHKTLQNETVEIKMAGLQLSMKIQVSTRNPSSSQDATTFPHSCPQRKAFDRVILFGAVLEDFSQTNTRNHNIFLKSTKLQLNENLELLQSTDAEIMNKEKGPKVQRIIKMILFIILRAIPLLQLSSFKTNKCTSFDRATQTIVQIINNGVHRKYYLRPAQSIPTYNEPFILPNKLQPTICNNSTQTDAVLKSGNPLSRYKGN